MILLASGSWIRKTILESSKFEFIVKAADIDERTLEAQHPNASVEELATTLARAKAEAVQKEYPDDLIIAADTFAVLSDGVWLHKPKSHEEAIELSLRQSGQTVRAVTGLVMSYHGKVITNSTSTSITYVDFDRDTIANLLDGDDPTIRNAGLGFFIDAPGFTLVKHFRGSYTGAMGLPMELVRENMQKLGYQEQRSTKLASAN